MTDKTPAPTPEQRAEWRRLAEAATPGRWHWWTSNSWKRLRSEQRAGVCANVLEPYSSYYDQHPNCIINEHDMAFIAAARTAVPALLDEVERRTWRPISEAKKDGTTIWAALRQDISIREGRDDLKRWDGLQIPLCHPGLADDGFDVGWSVAAPVGHGGFPDDWIAGWMPLPSPPEGPSHDH